MWSFPGFACPLVLYIPCAFSALAARPICGPAVLSLFPVSCSLHSFPFFPRRQSFQFLQSAVGNCVSFVTSYFCFCFVFCFCFFFVTIILFFLNLLPCPADHEPDWQPRAVFFLFFLFVNMVGARSVNVMNTTTTTTYLTAEVITVIACPVSNTVYLQNFQRKTEEHRTAGDQHGVTLRNTPAGRHIYG